MTQLVLEGIKTELHTSEFVRFSLCKIVLKNVIYTKNCRFDNIVNSPIERNKGLQMNDVNTEQFDLAEFSKLRGVADERRRVVIHS